jgi:hypothetical protein
MQRRYYLLHMLLTLLAARGLAPDALDPWRTWIAFKEYARAIDDEPDPGVSVQLIHREDQTASLIFLRQVLKSERDQLTPVGGVVCEMIYPPNVAERPDWEFWTFDYSTFERFIDIVESHSPFTHLMLRWPGSSAVYWEDA